jgi:hypothetical protein
MGFVGETVSGNARNLLRRGPSKREPAPHGRSFVNTLA